MTSWLTDKRFLIGLALGTFVMPYVTKTVTMQLARMRGQA